MAQIKSVLKINFSQPEIDRSYDGSTVARPQAVIRNIPPVLRTSNDIVALRNQLPARQSEHQIREGISTSQVIIKCKFYEQLFPLNTIPSFSNMLSGFDCGRKHGLRKIDTGPPNHLGKFHYSRQDHGYSA